MENRETPPTPCHPGQNKSSLKRRHGLNPLKNRHRPTRTKIRRFKAQPVRFLVNFPLIAGLPKTPTLNPNWTPSRTVSCQWNKNFWPNPTSSWRSSRTSPPIPNSRIIMTAGRSGRVSSRIGGWEAWGRSRGGLRCKRWRSRSASVSSVAFSEGHW